MGHKNRNCQNKKLDFLVSMIIYGRLHMFQLSLKYSIEYWELKQYVIRKLPRINIRKAEALKQAMLTKPKVKMRLVKLSEEKYKEEGVA